jgi:DNA-binding transcriptional LysR family regulator
LKPTSAALDLVPHAEAMATAADALVRQATGRVDDEQGAVRVTVSELIGVEVVAPLLPAFRERHSRIAIELALSSRTEDLLRREADIAVRLFRPTQSALVAKRVGELGMGLYAHPDYVARRSKPKDLQALSEHALVGFDSESLIRRGEKYGLPLSRDAYTFRCDSYLGQTAAVRSGFGIGLYLHAPAKRDGLVRILGGEVDVGFDVWLAMHEDLRTHRRVRLLFEFLADELAICAETDARFRASRRANPKSRTPFKPG